ncbi:hypothetical protein H8957_017564, partial [Semnopithecus entellus]
KFILYISKMIYQCYLPKEVILFFPFGKILLSSNVRIRSLDSVSTCTVKLHLEPNFSTCKQFPIKIV